MIKIDWKKFCEWDKKNISNKKGRVLATFVFVFLITLFSALSREASSSSNQIDCGNKTGEYCQSVASIDLKAVFYLNFLN